MASSVARLRELLADESKLIVCPGVYDGLTARIALQAGFDALYMVSNMTEVSPTLLILQ
jgi:2-methylisocitrate lyase-like PEP mutase family enzyme